MAIAMPDGVTPSVSVNGGPYTALAAGSSPLGTLGALAARSATVLGTTDFAVVFDELEEPLASGWQVLGTWTASGTKGPGVFGVASANDAVIIRQGLSIVAAPQTTPWHMAGRQQVLAFGAGDIKGFQFVAVAGNPDTDSVFVGIRQTVSATKFVFSLIKATVVVNALSTVNIDTNWHKLELWFNGTQVFGSVDGETPVLVGAAANCPTVPMQERHGCDLGAGAAVDQFYDYTYAAAARTIA
jgi:hypothetical protein